MFLTPVPAWRRMDPHLNIPDCGACQSHPDCVPPDGKAADHRVRWRSRWWFTSNQSPALSRNCKLVEPIQSRSLLRTGPNADQ